MVPINTLIMRQKTFVLYNQDTEFAAKAFADRYALDRIIFSQDLTVTEDVLKDIVSTPYLGDYFYILRLEEYIELDKFKFDYVPPEWDKRYVHIWNNDSSVRLYNTETVKNSIGQFTDKELFSGNVEIKDIASRIYSYPTYDIVFLSYDESYADENFAKLKLRFPRAKRVHGVKGFFNAHLAAAKLSTSNMVYIVDADAEILPAFEFDYRVKCADIHSVHVWHSRNPVNGLEYGYGGVKLFPTHLLLSYKGSPVDFTTSVSKSLKVMEEVSNITKFNTDPFSAWRSGFRECAKLASKIIHNQNNAETEKRLDVWCNVGEETEFGDFAVMGAREGREFGLKFANQPDMLGLINDFEWLEKRFSES